MAEPVFFGAVERARFGWLHRPPPNVASGIGVVIVPPFGYEAVCAHRSLRVLAERAAAAGMIAVQFDLDGTGDSAGDETDPDRIGAWLASIAEACDLARAAGAGRLVLVGVRLGALLAQVAAARRTDVVGLATLAAPSSGKYLVREMRALHAIASTGFPAPPNPVPHDEVIGFPFTPETRAAVQALEIPAPSVPLLAIERERAGYVEMMLDPHHTSVPIAILDELVAFAAARAPLPTPPPPRDLEWSRHATFGDTVIEEAIELPNGCRAITSSPLGGPAPTRALILLNAGAIRWIGPNRLYVTLARRLAARGTLVVRMDLSGLGGSPARGHDNEVYAPPAVREVGAAVSWARRHGVTHVSVAGLCSGAYHALRAAIEGYPIDTVIPINPLTFHYVPGMPLDVQPHKVAETTARYERNVRSLAAWKKVLTGKVDVRRAATALALRARDRGEHFARDAARQLGISIRDDLGSELLVIAKRGVRVRFVFASADPGQQLLRDSAGRVVGQLEARGALSIASIDGPDHTFTPLSSHAAFLDAIAAAADA
jgi:pimeloyl-ACP methyl ester carboxylesterase